MPLSRITSASIANSAISAADIADGTITAVKIISVANTQITGNIISSQITSVGGSQITANTIANSAFQTGAVENYLSAAGLGFGMRNRIINGAMVIDQRNAGASVTLTSGGLFITDRFVGYEDTDGTMTGQQVLKSASSGNAPTGFSSSLLFTTGTADASLSAAQYVVFGQIIEGLNVGDLDWGTANASTITLSFYVKSSLTGTFSGSLRNSTPNRSYVFTYTINSANTWEQKSITIAGDTSGTWLTTNGAGINLLFSLGAGSTYSTTANAWTAGNFFSATSSTSVIGTAAATFYITGVQLEKGSTATSFDFRSYGTEFALCQRYYYFGTNCVYGYPSPNTGGYAAYQRYDFKVTMRTTANVVTTYTSQTNITSINASTRTTDFFTDQIVSTTSTNTTWAVSYTATAEL